MLRRDHSAFLPAPALFALAGLVFCLWNLWSSGQSDVLCLSAGCALFSDFTFAGVSLWWLGVAGFTLLLFLAVTGWLYLGLLFATLGLLLDCVLLAVMLSSTPCIPCLVAGLLLAIVYFLFVLHARNRKRSGVRGVFSLFGFLWSAIFVANIGVLAQGALEPWPILHATEKQGHVRIFFSPSCPACRELVNRIPDEYTARVTWYPVAENENDVRVIGALEARLANGTPLATALAEAMNAPLEGQWRLVQPDMLMLQLRLWRNHAHVMEGEGMLPLVEISGVPAFMLSSKTDDQIRPVAQPSPETPVRVEPEPVAEFDEEDDAELVIEIPSGLDIVGGCGPDQPDGAELCY